MMFVFVHIACRECLAICQGCFSVCFFQVPAKWRGDAFGHVLSDQALLVLPAGHAVLTHDCAAGASVELLYGAAGYGLQPALSG
jgi:hypothetical protein